MGFTVGVMLIGLLFKILWPLGILYFCCLFVVLSFTVKVGQAVEVACDPEPLYPTLFSIVHSNFVLFNRFEEFGSHSPNLALASGKSVFCTLDVTPLISPCGLALGLFWLNCRRGLRLCEEKWTPRS